jgi:hypothetical protein
MATAVFGSPIKKVYGETVSLTTTAAHLGFMPNYHEVLMYCASAFRMGIAPKLASVKYYNASTYTDYTAYATDRSSSTHVPLDAMGTTHYLYLGVTAPTRGFYFDIGSNANAENRTLDWEYLYDVSKPGYFKLTGTVSGALTVGETVTGQTSSVTATLVYSGATYIIVKDLSGRFTLGEDVDGAAQTCDDITAIDPVAVGTGYFTDVAGDSDGTDSTGSLAVDGLYSFTLPSVVKGSLTGINTDPLYWYRFTPSGALSATVDIDQIVPACDTTAYGYMEGGVSYQFSLNTTQCGAFEFDHTGTGTLNVNWLMH